MGNISSGINLKLRPKERKTLDGAFEQATTDRKMIYNNLRTDYLEKLLAFNLDRLEYFIEPYHSAISSNSSEKFYTTEVYQAGFSDSSAIGGRTYPVFSDNAPSRFDIINVDYELYNQLLPHDKTRAFGYLPTSGPFGLSGNSQNIRGYYTSIPVEPTNKVLKPKRLSIRTIF